MRRIRSRFSLLFLPTLFVASLAAFALPRGLPSVESPIGEQMEIISGVMRSLRRSVPDADKRAHCLELVVTAQEAVLAAKQGTPPMAAKLPEAERPAFVAAYRKTMVELLTRTLELEVALLDGEQEAIDDAYRKLRAMEDSGHERFTEDG